MSSALTTARAELHAQLLAAALTRTGDDGQPAPLEPERRHRYPQAGSYLMPCAWVGLAAVSPTAQQDVELEIPLVLAFDGSDTAQLQAIDENTAVIWDAVRQVDVGAGPARPQSATVQRLGPEGSSTFGVVVSVRVPLTTTTLSNPGHLAT